MTLGKWMAAQGRDQADRLTDPDLDAIRQEFANGKAPDPKEALKLETDKRNEEFRYWQSALAKAFVENPELDPSEWIATQAVPKGFHSGLLRDLPALRDNARMPQPAGGV
jgi:hypothetical protein